MRKVCIIGTAPSGVKAPYDDKSWEIWGVSERGDYVTRATRWFELHSDATMPQPPGEYRKCVKVWADGAPLYMLDPDPSLGDVKTYPRERIEKRFGTYFMSSSASWMYALAIEEGVEEIAVYGVDMEYGTEYAEQRTGMRHFMALAHAEGIKVHKLLDSGLAYEPVPYPECLEDPLLLKMKLRKESIDRFAKDCSAAKIANDQMIVSCNSKIEEARLSMKKGYDPEARMAKFAQQSKSLNEAGMEFQREASVLEGNKNEQEWLTNYLTP